MIGQHWEGSTGQGWEGEVTFLRNVPEHAHKGKMVDMMLCIPPPRQAGRMSAGVSRAYIHEAYLA